MEEAAELQSDFLQPKGLETTMADVFINFKKF